MLSSETFVINTIGSDAFVPVNKRLLRHFKGDASVVVFLGELIRTYQYHLTRNALEPDGSFPVPIRRMQKSIAYSAYKQERIAKVLMEADMCRVYLKGYPASKYALLNFDVISSILSVDDMLSKKAEQDKFYNELNAILSKRENYTSEAEVMLMDAQCDNMSIPLKGSIIILSKLFLDKFPSAEMTDWSSSTTGKLNYWVRGRIAGGKRLDYSIFERITRQISSGSFDQFISQMIFLSKSVPDVHFSEQVYDYRDILFPGRG